MIRRSEIVDLPALRRLAALDSRRSPTGPHLLAEIGGELVAAVSLETDEPAFADPFRRTEDVRRLLELQASSLRNTADRSEGPRHGDMPSERLHTSRAA